LKDKEFSMRNLILILGLATLLPTGAARAQVAAPNEAGVSMGHVHLVVQDLEAGKKFWTAMGGTHGTLGANEVFRFPGVLILVRKGDPSGGSVGSLVNHIGFWVANIQESVARWNAAGLKTEPGARAGQAYVTTPDGLVRIEILENTALTVPISFDHIHFWWADAGTLPEMQSWYAKTFGAKAGERGQFKSDVLPGVILLFAKTDTATVGTKGRGLDHIGFEIKDLEAFCKKLEASGVKLDMPFTKRPDLGISLAFITDPWGTYIELNEGLNKL
jgi:catechol 2,3-dioxygenase-like lactoylglutathione lyase family enzyme